MSDEPIEYGDLPYESVAVVLVRKGEESDKKGKEPELKQKRFLLKPGANVLGRMDTNTVFLDDSQVSRKHASITVGDTVELEDMGSTVGTMLNDRFLIGTQALFDNDEIRVGPYVLRMEVRLRESQGGMVFALAALLVAMVLVSLVVVFKDNLPQSAANQAATQEQALRNQLAQWQNWQTMELPGDESLAQDEVVVSAENAQAQFDFGRRLYNDRLSDLGNSYRAILHFKRALGICLLLDPYDRPAVANRSIDYLRELQELMRRNTERWVFAYQQNRKMRQWQDCYRILDEMLIMVPNERNVHYNWAVEQREALDRMFNQ